MVLPPLLMASSLGFSHRTDSLFTETLSREELSFFTVILSGVKLRNLQLKQLYVHGFWACQLAVGTSVTHKVRRCLRRDQ